MTDLLKDLEAVPVIAYAWRKEGMKGWALGHNPPTPNMLDFGKYEVRELTFRTHRAEIAEALKDARRYRALKALTHKDWTVAKDASRGGVFQFTGDDLDAAIDAAMHNSAREDGK